MMTHEAIVVAVATIPTGDLRLPTPPSEEDFVVFRGSCGSYYHTTTPVGRLQPNQAVRVVVTAPDEAKILED